MSVESDVEAVDDFDLTCKLHDAAYARGDDLTDADARFVRDNLVLDPKRVAAAAAVGVSALYRGMIDKKMKNKTKTNLRGGSNLPPKPTNTIAGKQNDKVSAAPVGFATQVVGQAPKITANGGTFRVAHRAYLGSVSNTTNYSTLQYYANPGIAGTFPWLHRIARRYEEYRFRKLTFEFRSVASSSTAGVVMLSFDYDASDAMPATKAAQAQTIPNIENNVWMSTKLEVPCNGAYRYVRSGDLAANLDIKTYDYGQMILSTAYGTSSAVVGELYVHYDIELRYPTEGPTTCALATGGLPIGKTDPVGGSLTFSSATAASPIAWRSSTTFYITQPGDYLVSYVAQGVFVAGSLGTPTLTGQASSSLYLVQSVSNTTAGTLVFVLRASTGDYVDLLPATNVANCTSISSIKMRVAICDYAALGVAA